MSDHKNMLLHISPEAMGIFTYFKIIFKRDNTIDSLYNSTNMLEGNLLSTALDIEMNSIILNSALLITFNGNRGSASQPFSD